MTATVWARMSEQARESSRARVRRHLARKRAARAAKEAAAWERLNPWLAAVPFVTEGTEDLPVYVPPKRRK
jgi:hypothetical protein